MLILSPAPMAKGANATAPHASAASKARGGEKNEPCIPASTEAFPKISTGTYRGRIMRDTRAPPLRQPTVKAAPIAPIRLKMTVPINNETSKANIAEA